MDWARQLAVAHGRSAAIVFQHVTPIACAQSGFQSPHHFSTAAVTLMQSGTVMRRRWLALSYVPTAACLGMAAFLEVKRVVWRGANGNICSVTFEKNDQPSQVQGAQAIVIQNHNHQYPPLPAALPLLPIPRVLAQLGHVVRNIFVPPAGTNNLIKLLVGADDVVRNNACMMLAFTIASIGHGPLQNNPNRSANYLGQNIASILVDSNYQIIRWGINTNNGHSSFHGEINLIRSFQANNMNALPYQGKLFSTLEPCVMCSGMIVHTAGVNNNFEVISGQTDAHVGFSALRNSTRIDGYTLNQRTVASTLSRLPLMPGQGFGDHMSHAQVRNTPAPTPGKKFQPMPTTLYLEQRAGPVMSDAAKMLDKMATLWIPTASRPAWRASRDQFLLHVQASIRG